MKKYEKMGFDDEQMIEIELGLIKGLDVSVYSKPDYDQMQEVRLGLQK